MEKEYYQNALDSVRYAIGMEYKTVTPVSYLQQKKNMIKCIKTW